MDTPTVTLTNADWNIREHAAGSVTDATTGALLIPPCGMTDEDWINAQTEGGS